MLHSNEYIALTHQAEALRQAKQMRLVREAQSKTNRSFTMRLTAATRGLVTTLTQRGSSSKAAARLDARHAR